MCRYVLLVFAESKNQDKFVKVLSEEIVGVADTADIKYFYGHQSVILTFISNAPFEDVKDYLMLTLGISNIVYFLIPYNTEQIGYWITPEVEKHLFDTDKMSEKPDNIVKENNQVRNLLFGDEIEPKNYLNEIFDLECEDDEIENNKKSKIVEKSLDDLLDKISKTGVSSLTKQELKLLHNYSK